MTMSSPVALRPEEVPEDLICSVCMSIPVHPVLTPCEHMFCRGCIHQALDRQNQCPVDREPCNTEQLKPPQGLNHRIWSNVKVKCARHSEGCAWTGPIGDYSSHALQCSGPRNGAEDYLALIRDLEQNLKATKEENRKLKAKMENIKHQVQGIVADATSTIIEQQGLVQREDGFDGNYCFRRENVVKLSQLIARYLEDKPGNINSNKIFDCVRSCYMDLERDYNDNPPHYRIDMKMLLATCEASTWFTNCQLQHIKKWYRDQF